MDEKFAARTNHGALADQPRNPGRNSEEQSGYRAGLSGTELQLRSVAAVILVYRQSIPGSPVN